MVDSNSKNDHGRRISGWLKDPPTLQPPLVKDLRADVVVVGAGYCGLSTALELRSRGVDVVVLERDFAGSGASGRNAGYLAGGMGLEFDLIIRRLGQVQAAAIVAFYDTAVRYVEQLFSRHQIDCDYDSTGLISSNIHPSQEARLRHQVETGRALGAEARFLPHSEMRQRGIPPAFLCGALSEIGGTLDPGKYALGLRRAAIEAGVQIFEGSPVVGIEEGEPVRVRTLTGSVTADACVLATNAYTPALGHLKRKVIPIRVSAIETEPLSGEQREALGWPNREGLITAHYLLESHRVTRRNTLVVTTKRINYLFGSRVAEGPHTTVHRILEQLIRDRLPMLTDVQVADRWSGWITFSGDTVPVIGAEGGHRNIFYASGCSGHGVGTQSLMGALLAERVQGREHELESALRRKVPTLPPEPLRWVACKLLLSAANAADAWTDRKARRASS